MGSGLKIGIVRTAPLSPKPGLNVPPPKIGVRFPIQTFPRLKPILERPAENLVKGSKSTISPHIDHSHGNINFVFVSHFPLQFAILEI